MVTEHEVKRYQSCMRQETEGTNPKEREPPPTGPGYGNLKSRGPHLRKPFHKWSPVTARQLCMNAIAPDNFSPLSRPVPSNQSHPLDAREELTVGEVEIHTVRIPVVPYLYVIPQITPDILREVCQLEGHGHHIYSCRCPAPLVVT